MTDLPVPHIACNYPVTFPVVTPPLSIDRGVTGGGVGHEK
jgi:hypothetical protein